jgi:hypothetical protein
MRGQSATLTQSTPLRSPKKAVGNSPHQIARLVVISSTLRRAVSLPFALYFARFPL